MKQVNDRGIDSNRVTMMFRKKASQEEIQRMWKGRYKALTYQRRKNNVPQVERQGPIRFPKNRQPIESSKEVSQGKPLNKCLT